MARRKGRKHVEEDHENAERWLLTYADMITLLMVLFIVLFAIGATDAKKFAKLHDGLAQSFGESTVLDGGSGLLNGSAVQAPDAPDDSRSGSEALQRQRMAVLAGAFVATLWGVLSGNAIWLPLSNKLKRMSEVEISQMELIVEGVLAVQSGTNPRLVEQKLRSILPAARDKGAGPASKEAA